MPNPAQDFNVWSMHFISGLPSSQVYNTSYTCIEKLTKFVRLIPCFKGEGALSAPKCINLLSSNIIRLFDVPKMVFYDGNPRYTKTSGRAYRSI